jgi:sensor histidine kinase regulating citrate/malate metabolism
VRVSAELSGAGAAPRLRVCDTGRAVPLEISRALLRAPVRSNNGLGIGLYQAARQAQASGYELVLETNRDGMVCFVLRRAVGGA